jgi:peptide chain release factor 1
MVTSMLPENPDLDKTSVVLEIRGGAGGTEAALFARDLFGMYQKYAGRNRWLWENIQGTDNIAVVKGNAVYRKLRHEIGVHRVQRIPTTESSGRLHTSTATVAVLPEVKEIEFVMNPKDLRIEVCRSQGAGGQHVNTTDSAVRVTHIPTGVSVFIQDDRSQHKNRARALDIVRARVYDLEKQKHLEERESARAKQVGTGQRHERIRTYNWPQSRVKDHRINYLTNDLDGMLDGGDALDEFIDRLDDWTVRQERETFISTVFH